MKKELLLIVYKININGLSRQQADQQIYNLMSHYNLSEDKDLKDDYIIKEMWLPITQGISDIKVIYPVPLCVKSANLDDLIEEVILKMNENPESSFIKLWEKLLRQLKLRKLENYE